MNDIKEIAERFNEETAKLTAASNKLRDIDVDIAMAERNRQPTDALDRDRKSVLMNEWSPAHALQQQAAHALCEALGVDSRKLRIALA